MTPQRVIELAEELGWKTDGHMIEVRGAVGGTYIPVIRLMPLLEKVYAEGREDALQMVKDDRE